MHGLLQVRLKISEICSLLNVDGIRGDIVINRAARALVALEGRTTVELSDVGRIISICLNHRQASGLDFTVPAYADRMHVPGTVSVWRFCQILTSITAGYARILLNKLTLAARCDWPSSASQGPKLLLQQKVALSKQRLVHSSNKRPPGAPPKRLVHGPGFHNNELCLSIS